MKLTLDFKIDKTEVIIEKDGKEIPMNELNVSDLRVFLHRLPEVRIEFERMYRKLV